MSDRATNQITIPANPSLSLAKLNDAATPVKKGDTVTYTFTVNNTGNVTLHDITISDILAGISATTPTSIATLAPNTSATLTATYVVLQSDVDAGAIHNTATGHGLTAIKDLPVTSNTASSDVTVAQTAKLSLSKSGVGPSTAAHVGDTVTFTFSVQNTGTVTLHNVAITDLMPGISATNPTSVANLNVGALATFTATYLITQSDINTGSVANNASAHALDPQAHTVTSPSASATVTLVQAPKITLKKTAAFSSPLAKNSVITYTFTVTNSGNTTVTNISVSDLLAGLGTISPATIVSLAPGLSTAFTATYTVTQGDVDAGQIVNAATASATAPGNTHLTASDSVTLPISQSPSMTLIKSSATSHEVNKGDTVTYTFTVKNTGDVTLRNVSVTDPLVGLSAISPTSAATLAPNASTTFTATYVVTQNDVDAGVIHNTAKAHASDPATNPITDAPSSFDFPIAQHPALTVKKTSTAGTNLKVDDTVTYTFTIKTPAMSRWMRSASPISFPASAPPHR